MGHIGCVQSEDIVGFLDLYKLLNWGAGIFGDERIHLIDGHFLYY